MIDAATSDLNTVYAVPDTAEIPDTTLAAVAQNGASIGSSSAYRVQEVLAGFSFPLLSIIIMGGFLSGYRDSMGRY